MLRWCCACSVFLFLSCVIVLASVIMIVFVIVCAIVLVTGIVRARCSEFAVRCSCYLLMLLFLFDGICSLCLLLCSC